MKNIFYKFLFIFTALALFLPVCPMNHANACWFEKKILPTDGAAGDRFGESVAISGNIAVVGAKRRCLDFKKYEKILNRNISVNFYDDFNSISAEIKGSLCNGVNLAGGLGP